MADFQKFSEENDDYKYILIGVDTLSKMFFASPVRRKYFEDIKDAFEKLFKQMPMLPHRIFSDRVKFIHIFIIKKY